MKPINNTIKVGKLFLQFKDESTCELTKECEKSIREIVSSGGTFVFDEMQNVYIKHTPTGQEYVEYTMGVQNDN